ncbi:MAG TPA: TolC family protein [Planctomycetota bacterium]|nr:TolC family protein [Planctomycetota bacterium]
MNRLHGLRHVAPGLLLAGLAACAAPDVDPAPDYQEASRLVAERSDWDPGWQAPWADDTTTWDGTSPLAASQAVTVALHDNRGLRSELEGIAGAKADLAQAGLLPNPTFSAALLSTVDGPANAFSIAQELAQLWLRPPQTDAAAAALRAAVQSVGDHALRLAADVRAAHARVVHAQRGVELLAANADVIQRALDVAQRRLDAGEGTQLDVNRLREELLSAQSDQQTQQLELLTTRRDLLALMGRADAPAEWQVVADPRLQPAGLGELTEADAVARATGQRLDVQAARSIYEQRRHELSAASRGAIPDIAVGYDWGKDQDDLRSHGFDFSIEVPLFDTHSVAEAKAGSDVRAAAADADQVLQTAVNQTRSAFLTLQANARLVAFFRDQVLALAHDNQAAAQRAWDVGEADVTVVLDTQREVSDAEIKLNDLELDLATSAAELEYVVGGKL